MSSKTQVSSDDVIESYQKQLSDAHYVIALRDAQVKVLSARLEEMTLAARDVDRVQRGPVETGPVDGAGSEPLTGVVSQIRG